MSSLEGEAVVAVLRIGQIILPKTVSFSSTIKFLKVGIEPRDPHLQGAGAFVHGPKHGHEPVMWFLLLLFCGNFVKDRLWIGFVFFWNFASNPVKKITAEIKTLCLVSVWEKWISSSKSQPRGASKLHPNSINDSNKNRSGMVCALRLEKPVGPPNGRPEVGVAV